VRTPFGDTQFSTIRTLAYSIMEILKSKGEAKTIAGVKEKVLKLTARFPLP